MPTDFEKQFGSYGDLSDIPGASFFEAGAHPDMPPEGQASRLVRLAGKGLTFGLGQRDIEAQNLPEYAAEFAGSIPSTVAASMAAGPLVGMGARALGAGAGLAKLAPVARNVLNATVVGTTIGTGKAVMDQDISQIPTEAAWWGGSELIGQGLMKGGARLFGKGVAKEVKPAMTPDIAAGIERQKATQRGQLIEDTLMPPRAVEPTGPRMPPPETPGKIPTDGPKVRFVKVTDEPINFDDVPDITFGTTTMETPRFPSEELSPDAVPMSAKTGLAKLRGSVQAAEEGRGGIVSQMEKIKSKFAVPTEMSLVSESGSVTGKAAPTFSEGDIAKFSRRFPTIPEEEIRAATTMPGDKLNELYHTNMDNMDVARGAKPAINYTPSYERATMYHEMEMARTQMRPQDVAERLAQPPGDVQNIKRFTTPGEPLFKVIQPPAPPKPSLDGFVESFHDNPDIHENLRKPLKEAVEPRSGATMVVPKTPQARQIIDFSGNVTRYIEPPITNGMQKDLIKPLNTAKLDHGLQMEQFRTSNLLKKTDEEIEAITAPLDGTGTIKPFKSVTIDESPNAKRVRQLITKQGLSPEEMTDFVAQKTKEWEEVIAPRLRSSAEALGASPDKTTWLKDQVLTELKRRGPC